MAIVHWERPSTAWISASPSRTPGDSITSSEWVHVPSPVCFTVVVSSLHVVGSTEGDKLKRVCRLRPYQCSADKSLSVITPTPGVQARTVGVSIVVPTWMRRQHNAHLSSHFTSFCIITDTTHFTLRKDMRHWQTLLCFWIWSCAALHIVLTLNPKAALPHVLPCEAACGGVL